MSGQSTPRFVYRYLQREEDALAFVAGRVWLSTVERVRYHDAHRADALDARLAYDVTALGPETPPSVAETIKGRISSVIRNADDVPLHLKGLRLTQDVRDAYLLCTSLDGRSAKLRRLFGRHVVRIAKPAEFAQKVLNALGAAKLASTATLAPVQYKGQTFADAEASVGSPGFASRASLADEREFRFLFRPERAPDGFCLAPVVLDVPAAAVFCSIVS